MTQLWALLSQLRQTLTLSVPGLTHTWQQALVVWQKDQTVKCLYGGSSSVRGTQHDSGACLSWLTVGKGSGKRIQLHVLASCYSKHAQSFPTISATSHCVRHSPFSSSFPRYLLPPSHKASTAFIDFFFLFKRKSAKLGTVGCLEPPVLTAAHPAARMKSATNTLFFRQQLKLEVARLEATNTTETLSRQEECGGA